MLLVVLSFMEVTGEDDVILGVCRDSVSLFTFGKWSENIAT